MIIKDDVKEMMIAMGNKDIAEKTLESFADVFADLMNVFLFEGEIVVREEDLREASPQSFYKMEDKSRELVRDVAMFWHDGLIRIASIGLENQTTIDQTMPLRAMIYDAIDYKRQLDLRAAGGAMPLHPVLTFVLYFGSEREWIRPRSLLETMDVDARLAPFVNDYKLNVISVAHLEDESIDRFKSDFGSIARLLSNMRRGRPPADGLNRRLVHALETMQLVSALTGNTDIERRYAEDIKGGSAMTTLGEYLNDFRRSGIIEGEARGFERGEVRGEARGEARGKAMGIIAMGRDCDLPDEKIISSLISRLNVSTAEAEKMLREIDA